MFSVRTVLPWVFLATSSGAWAQTQIPLTLEGEKPPVEVRPAIVKDAPVLVSPPAASAPGIAPAPASASVPAPAPGAGAGAAMPGEVKPPRAIIVEEPAPSETPAPEVLARLPRTLPADVKLAYSQCKVPGKVIAITFDDGPNPETTPRLLDYLKERGIKATFFLVGKNAAAYPNVVQRILAEGHELGNHSWTHPIFSQLRQERVDSELKKTHDAIVAACGTAPLLYRPPYGAIRLNQKKHIQETLGYPTILWDVDPNDWQAPRTQEKVYTRVLAQTRPGSIILCHDIHKPTVDAMPATLDELRNRGFQFVTVTQLLNLDSQTVASMPVQVAAHHPKGPAGSALETLPAPAGATGAGAGAGAGQQGAASAVSPEGAVAKPAAESPSLVSPPAFQPEAPVSKP